MVDLAGSLETFFPERLSTPDRRILPCCAAWSLWSLSQSWPGGFC